MIQCKKCEKCVHRECDQTHADMVPYRCPNCRVPYKHEVRNENSLTVSVCRRSIVDNGPSGKKQYAL